MGNPTRKKPSEIERFAMNNCPFTCIIYLIDFKVNLPNWWKWSLQHSLIVPHKAVAEVSKIGNLWEVSCCDAWMAEQTHWLTERWLRLWFSLSLSPSLPHSPSLLFSLPVYISCVYIFLADYLSRSLSLCLCVFIYLSACLFSYLPGYICFSPRPPLSLYLSLSLSLSIPLSIYLSTYLLIYRSIYLSICLSVCLSLCLSLSLSLSISVLLISISRSFYVAVYASICLSSYLKLPVYLAIYLFIWKEQLWCESSFKTGSGQIQKVDSSTATKFCKGL